MQQQSEQLGRQGSAGPASALSTGLRLGVQRVVQERLEHDVTEFLGRDQDRRGPAASRAIVMAISRRRSRPGLAGFWSRGPRSARPPSRCSPAADGSSRTPPRKTCSSAWGRRGRRAGCPPGTSRTPSPPRANAEFPAFHAGDWAGIPELFKTERILGYAGDRWPWCSTLKPIDR